MGLPRPAGYALCGRNTSRKNQPRQTLRLAAWNVRTLLDNADRHERRTAIISRELARYNIDIAALSETRLSGNSKFTEPGGYTFYCIGQPDGVARQGDVGFAVRNTIAPKLVAELVGISTCLMTLELCLPHGQRTTLLSAYAPTMLATDDAKEDFYTQLDKTISAVLYKHKLFILGDFNARVGRDFTVWKIIFGRHGVGSENANGSLLLETCVKHEQAVTNIVFQQANKYKTTWMHPRSKHWHMPDYVLTRKRDLKDVRLIRVMRGTSSWSDHRLVRCSVFLSASRPHRRRQLKVKQLDVAALKNPQVQISLQRELDAKLLTGTTHLAAIVNSAMQSITRPLQ